MLPFYFAMNASHALLVGHLLSHQVIAMAQKTKYAKYITAKRADMLKEQQTEQRKKKGKERITASQVANKEKLLLKLKMKNLLPFKS